MDSTRYMSTSFGEARRTPGRHGYVAYFPASIPRRVELPTSLVRLLADAEAALGALSGVGQLLPDPHLLIRPYVRREALASTRIEGTRASLIDVLDVEAGKTANADVEEVLNYIIALEWGLEQVHRLPLGERLIRGMHKRLLAGVRGRKRAPGELRTTQNWVGRGGSTIETARFVPPPPEELGALLSDWERFAHEDSDMPLLMRNALLHYQFETLHPFLDGNGRLGRLLIIFMLVERGRLEEPLLYISPYFERDRDRYYEALQTIREVGDPLPWFEFFLEAVRTQSTDAVARARRLVSLREDYRAVAAGAGSANMVALVDLVCAQPVLSARSAETRLDVARPTALKLLQRLVELGVLSEGEPGPRRQRRFVADELLNVLDSETARFP